MRRHDKEIADLAGIEAILKQARVCRLALSDADGYPYVIPVNFGWHDGTLIMHSAPQGKKIDLIRRDPRVCFEVDVDTELVVGSNVCSWGMRYRSVIGRGRARIIEDDKTKRELLGRLVEHYSGHKPESFPRDLDDLVVIAVDVESMSGKEGRKDAT